MNNTIQVRLEDGTVGLIDKFLVNGVSFDTYLEAQESLNVKVYKQLDLWLDAHTFLLSMARESLINDIDKVSKDNLKDLIDILNNLLNLKGD